MLMNSSHANDQVSGPEFDIWYYIIEGLFGVLTVIGNGFVVFLISTRRCLQFNHNYYILSLALADLLLGFSLPTFSILCSHTVKCDWLAFYKFFNLFAYTSVANLCLMTFDRYFAIIYPLMYINKMTKKLLFASVAVSWLVPAFLAMLPFIWMYDSDKKFVKKSNDIYYLTLLVFFELLPVVAMFIAYCRIFIIVRKHSIQVSIQKDQLTYNNQLTLQFNDNEVKKEQTPYKEDGAKNSHADAFEKRKSSLLSNEAARSSTIALGLVILLFVLCWSYDIYITLCTRVTLCQIGNVHEEGISNLLIYLNSVVNPFVYFLFKKDVRRELSEFFQKVF